jgi:hypothetical protein
VIPERGVMVCHSVDKRNYGSPWNISSNQPFSKIIERAMKETRVKYWIKEGISGTTEEYYSRSTNIVTSRWDGAAQA